MGIGTCVNGVFNLYVSFTYDARSEKDQWQTAFNNASLFLMNATNGKMKFGTITAANKNSKFNPKTKAIDEADAIVLAYGVSGSRSNLQHECNDRPCLGILKRCFYINNEHRFLFWYIIHEFGHYALGLYDEYIDENYQPAVCCYSQYPDKCIMEVMDLNVPKYCTPAEHTTNNWQHQVNGESCWETICRFYKEIMNREDSFSDHTITWVGINFD